MSDLGLNYIPNKTTKFVSKLNKYWSMAGLPNLFEIDMHNKLYKYFHMFATSCIFTFIISEIAAFFTQSPLSDRQSNDLVIFSFSHVVLITFYIGLEYHKTEVKGLLTKLCITLKNVYNDPDVEMRMIKKAFYYTIAHFTVSVSLSSYGYDGLLAVIRSDGSFITVVTAWPDIEDKSALANIVRFVIYIIWWIFIIRVTAAITVVIVITIALSHQYKNLQSYFYSLDDIFQNVNDENDQNECEAKYVEALKVGIKLHSDTLWCTRQCQVTCSLVYSGQILITMSVLCLLMLQMVNSERTLTNAVTIITTGSAVLTSSGFVMWNAGDVTIEASLVPTAMFASGWHHCQGATFERVRKLLFVAMIQGQKHIVLRSFGVFEISYSSYLSLVKSSYSAFSLLY